MLVITPYFNPQKYKSLKNNHRIFTKRLLKQGANLITVELTFGDEPPELTESDLGKVVFLKSNSVMWQKEQIINYVINNHMEDEATFAWIDCDVLFKDNSWIKRAEDKLKEADIIQLFKRVFLLNKGQTEYGGERNMFFQGVVWQYKTYKNWLSRRISKELPFSHPGFAWAARKDALPKGLYPFSITGSGDTLMVDSLLDSWDIHSYSRKFTEHMKISINEWIKGIGPIKLDYIPEDIYHLWHGSIKNRAYTTRHNMLVDYDFNPFKDVTIKGDVLEWNSNKVELHNAIKAYFLSRNEDEDI